MFRHILLTSSIRNVWRTVGRICIFISGLKVLMSSSSQLIFSTTVFFQETESLRQSLLEEQHARKKMEKFIRCSLKGVIPDTKWEDMERS